MTAAEQILSGIEGMRAAVAMVTREWEPADLPRVEACRITLETSLLPLGATLQRIPADRRLREAAEALRNEVSGLEFLVDAAAAFVRAAACLQGQSYTPAGEVGVEAPLASTETYTG